MSHALLVLGGGPLAAAALAWARAAGLHAVLAAPAPSPRARRLASAHHALPLDDAEAHRALALRLAREGHEVSVLAAESRACALLPRLADATAVRLAPRRALELLTRSAAAHELLARLGFALAAEDCAGDEQLDVCAFFRDGAFVPSGIARRRTLASGDVLSVQPSGLTPEGEHAAYLLAERAARALGYERGPLLATLSAGGTGLALVRLTPTFADAWGAAHVAPLAYGRSPLQSWLAHLAGAGGPFDEFPLTPRATAGWLALAPPRPGLFAGLDGTARARATPGVCELWIDEPGRVLRSPELEREPLACLWAEGHDRAELESRLRSARAALEVRIACRQVA